MKVNKLKKYIRRVNSPVFQNMKESYKEKVNNLIASFNVTKETVAKYGFKHARKRKEVYDKLVIRWQRKSVNSTDFDKEVLV